MGREKTRRKRRLRRPRGMGKAEWSWWSPQDKRDIVKRRKSRFRRHLNIFNTMTIILIALLLISGCGSMKGEAYTVYGDPLDPNRITVRYYKASYETLFIDWERHGFSAAMDGFGSVGSDKSRVESEGAEIAEDVSEVLSPAKAVGAMRRAVMP